MPLVLLGTGKGGPILRCINHDSILHPLAPGAKTTMHPVEQWNGLMIANPPRASWMPRFNAEAGLPVRCYICSVCGYVEMYYAPIIDPNEWPRGR